MGGFVDPFVPAPAWPQDIGSSWAGTGTASSSLGHQDQMASPVELHETFLNAQQMQDGLSFQVDSSEAHLLGGALLSTPCAMPLADSAPVVCSSNDDDDSSGGSEHSLLPQLLLGDAAVPAPAAAWPSAFAHIASLVGEEASRSYGFGVDGKDDLLLEACREDGNEYTQLAGNVPSAPLQQQDDVEFNTGKIMLSFAPGPAGQQVKTDLSHLQISQKELSGLHHLNLSALVSGQLSSFSATGAALYSKQSNEVSGGKIGLNVPPFATQSEVPNGNGIAGNGAPKPRVRARRGQATDPHSIAERLRREKISDRMKNLQELIPNSNRTDKATMLDEIIEYVKFLQLQVKVLSMSRLGATEAVVPLLTESQTESSGGLLLSPRSAGKQQAEPRDGAAFEQEVVQLMENNMTTAMQYLQSKGMCLMPIALASAISDQKGSSSAAIQPLPENGEAVDEGAGGEERDAKEMMRALKPLGGPREMRSRA